MPLEHEAGGRRARRLRAHDRLPRCRGAPAEPRRPRRTCPRDHVAGASRRAHRAYHRAQREPAHRRQRRSEADENGRAHVPARPGPLRLLPPRPRRRPGVVRARSRPNAARPDSFRGRHQDDLNPHTIGHAPFRGPSIPGEGSGSHNRDSVRISCKSGGARQSCAMLTVGGRRPAKWPALES
jgi:hypothetical protein